MNIEDIKRVIKEAADEVVGAKLVELEDRIVALETALEEALLNAKDVADALTKAEDATKALNKATTGSQQVSNYDTEPATKSAHRDAFGRRLRSA